MVSLSISGNVIDSKKVYIIYVVVYVFVTSGKCFLVLRTLACSILLYLACVCVFLRTHACVIITQKVGTCEAG